MEATVNSELKESFDHFRRKLPSFGWHSWAWRQLWSWSLRMFRQRWCQFDSFKSEHVYMKSNLSYASSMFIPFDKSYYLQDAYPTISIDPPFKEYRRQLQESWEFYKKNANVRVIIYIYIYIYIYILSVIASLIKRYSTVLILRQRVIFAGDFV